MSGRLIILRHKSWNVWNKENIEKVKRDERINREEIEKKKENERKLHSEKIMELLNNNKKEGEGGGEGEGREEIEIDRTIQNDEYRKEKEEKELLQKRREGSAPWALGEGSSEFQKISPWYLENNNNNSNNNSLRIGGKILHTNDEIQAALDRDLARKKIEDPMSAFLYTAECKEEYDVCGNREIIQSENQNQLIISKSNNSKSTSLLSNNLTCNLPGLTHLNPFLMGGNNYKKDHNEKDHKDENKKSKKRKHKSKKEKKSNKKSKKKDKKKDHHNRKERESNINSSSSDSSGSDSESNDDNNNKFSISKKEIEILRQRRNEREKNERIRENELLTRYCE